MTSRASARPGPLLLAALLLAAAVGPLGVMGAEAAVTRDSASADTSPSHGRQPLTVESTSENASVSAATRSGDDSRLTTGRLFAITLAAILALAALLAARCALVVWATLDHRTTFDVRRRGPPLLCGS